MPASQMPRDASVPRMNRIAHCTSSAKVSKSHGIDGAVVARRPLNVGVCVR
jgi:hypothetical protein